MDGLLDPLPGMPGQVVKKKKASGARWVDPNVRAAQMDLERLLGVRVRIRDRKGKGKIVIEYSTLWMIMSGWWRCCGGRSSQ